MQRARSIRVKLRAILLFAERDRRLLPVVGPTDSVSSARVYIMLPSLTAVHTDNVYTGL